MSRPLTSVEVVEYLRVSTHTLGRLLADGERAGIAPPCVLVGRQRRWYADQLDEWLREVEAWRRPRSRATTCDRDGHAIVDVALRCTGEQ